MVTDATLKAFPRKDKGKSFTRKIRATGKVPAVVYGRGEDTRMVTVDAHELDQLFSRVHWENTIIRLEIEGERADVRALVREVQSHPVRRNVLHVDFQQIHAGERVHVAVPVRLVGTAAGVRAGGMVMHTMTDLEVWCMPDQIPEVIEVDISQLQIGDSVHLSDLTLPEGVETAVDDDMTVCSVAPPAVVTAVEPIVEEPVSSEPEVIRRVREDEE
jgi:large subunit ribosomal protein L25